MRSVYHCEEGAGTFAGLMRLSRGEVGLWRSAMRTSICLGIALVAGFAQFAAAQDAGTGPAPTAEQRAAATKLLKLELIQKRLEAAGLKDVRVSPEVHVV